MRFKQVGNKKDIVAIIFQNNEATVEIKSGAPVFLKPDGTVPGLSGVSAESLANANQGFFAGLNIGSVAGPILPASAGGGTPANVFGEAQAYGMFDYARVLLSTRAASTDVWASYAAIALGDIMQFVTTAGVQAVQRSGAGSATNNGWFAVAGQTVVSATTQASSVANGIGNSTAMVTALRVMLRSL